MTKSKLHISNLSAHVRIPASPYFGDRQPAVPVENLKPHHDGRRQGPAGGALRPIEPKTSKGR